jgi:hypothetical protein
MPRAKTPQTIAFLLGGMYDWMNMGIGIKMIITSEEMLMTAFAMR